MSDKDLKKNNKAELIAEVLKLRNDALYMHHQIITPEENQNLPLPRLQIKSFQIPIKEKYDYPFINIYGIVRLNVMNQIEFSVFQWSKTSGPETLAELTMSDRLGHDMRNDMFELNLPGYYIKGSEATEITLTDPMDFTWSLKEKMKKRSQGLQ